MSWRNRNMFTQMPQGITSGLAPIPRYKMGGMVQYYNGGGKTYPNEGLKALAKVRPDVVKKMGYKEGGKTYPNEGLKALAKVAPEVVERMGYEEGGEVFPVDQAMNFVQGTGPMGVPMPSGMPAQVFEEGDDEINAALNNMLAAVKPQGDAPMMDMQEAPTKDKGQDTTKLITKTTETFKQAARDFVKEAKEKSEGSLTTEQQAEVLDGLQEIDMRYKRAIVDIASSKGDDVTEEEITLLTPDFVEELDVVATANVAKMQEGSVVEKPSNLLEAMENTQKILNDISSMNKAVRDVFNTGSSTKETEEKEEAPASKTPDPLAVQTALQKALSNPLNTDLMRERMERNRLGTLLSGKSLQGGVAGLVDVAGQAALSESEGMGTVPEREAIASGDLIKDAFKTETSLLTTDPNKKPVAIQKSEAIADLYRRSQLPPGDPEYLSPEELNFQLQGFGIKTQEEMRAALKEVIYRQLLGMDDLELQSLYESQDVQEGDINALVEKLIEGAN